MEHFLLQLFIFLAAAAIAVPAAKKLGLAYEYRETGYGDLETFMRSAG